MQAFEWPSLKLVKLCVPACLLVALLACSERSTEPQTTSGLHSTTEEIADVAHAGNIDLDQSKVSAAPTATCVACHQREHASWLESDHARSMNEPTSQSVLGDFDNAELKLSDRTLRFYKEGEKFIIEEQLTDARSQLQASSYEVKYTFGFHPLQQYLLSTERGKLQAFDIAWDNRPVKDGGQRWYELLANEDKLVTSPFNWQGHLANWNSRCAECHSTIFTKQFTPVDAIYASTYFEVNVGCASCHQDTASHVEKAQAGRKHTYDSFYKEKYALDWMLENNASVATPQMRLRGSNALANDESEEQAELYADEIDTCAGCHSRRSVHQSGQSYRPYDFFSSHSLALIEPPIYHRDGQIREEVFVTGSFLQSKMAALGVTCSNCHDPHSGKMKFSGNTTCTQCHRSEVYNAKTHHGHDASGNPSDGTACVDCHMRAEIYMGTDSRRDHRFHIPHPESSKTLEAPLACFDCHKDRSYEWASSFIRDLKVASDRDVQDKKVADHELFDVADMEADHRSVIKASAISLKARSFLENSSCEESNSDRDAFLKLVDDALRTKAPNIEDALTLQSGLSAMSNTCMSERWSRMQTFLGNSELWSGPTLYAAFSSVIADPWDQILPQLTVSTRSAFEKAKAALRKSVEYTQDFAATQNILARLCIKENNFKCAFRHFNTAEKIDPIDFATTLNHAEFLRTYQGSSDSYMKAERLLERLALAYPNAAEVSFAQGMLAVTQQHYQKAVDLFKVAVGENLQTAHSQHIFTLAVALENAGDIEEATVLLENSLAYHALDETIVRTLSLYWLKQANKGIKTRDLIRERARIVLDHSDIVESEKDWLRSQLSQLP